MTIPAPSDPTQDFRCALCMTPVRLHRVCPYCGTELISANSVLTEDEYLARVERRAGIEAIQLGAVEPKRTGECAP